MIVFEFMKINYSDFHSFHFESFDYFFLDFFWNDLVMKLKENIFEFMRRN